MVAPVQNKTILGNTRSTSLHNSKLFTSSGKGKGILEDSSPKKRLYWHLSEKESGTRVSLIKLSHEEGVLAVWVCLSFNWLYPVVDAMESISFPSWKS